MAPQRKYFHKKLNVPGYWYGKTMSNIKYGRQGGRDWTVKAQAANHIKGFTKRWASKARANVNARFNRRKPLLQAWTRAQRPLVKNSVGSKRRAYQPGNMLRNMDQYHMRELASYM